MPCHMDIDYTDPDWAKTQEPTAPLCVGAMQYQNNNMKLSRDPEIAEAQRVVGNNANVFSSPEEFLIHHKFGRWEGPVETSMWWRGHPVNFALGYTDILTVAHIKTEGMEEGGIYLGYDKDGDVIRIVEDNGKSLAEVEWLNDYYQGRGNIAWRDVSDAEYRKWSLVAEVAAAVKADPSLVADDDEA